jgi:hypothetical protein
MVRHLSFSLCFPEVALVAKNGYYPYLATGATFEKQSEKPVGISRSFGKRKKNRIFFCAHMHTVETK